jgi:hypothetical protein
LSPHSSFGLVFCEQAILKDGRFHKTVNGASMTAAAGRSILSQAEARYRRISVNKNESSASFAAFTALDKIAFKPAIVG